MDNYSISEFVTNTFSLIRTKIFYNQCRFIRFPFYLRGRKSLSGGKGLTLGRFCRFELDGKKKTLFINNDVQMGDMTHIVALENVKVGNNVLIASKCFISDTSHGCYSGVQQDSPLTPPNKRKLFSNSVIIGDNVWIGENAVILAGAEIGDGCIIGANSIVSKKIPPNSIVINNNRIIKQYSIDEQKWKQCYKNTKI